MSKHNYSQYSSNKKTAAGNKSEDKSTMTVVEPSKPTEPVLVRETVDTVKLPKTVVGSVANCNKLNVRVAPVAGAEIVTVIEAGTKVIINVAESTDEWFSVRIGNNAEGYNGYCMKKFIDARL